MLQSVLQNKNEVIKIELREYQQTFTNALRMAFTRKNRAVLGVLSCGGGKSVIAAMIAKSATDKNKRVLFLVHRKELCEQITQTFEACKVNMILCTVGMVQTITKRTSKMPPPDLIIVDEAHHSTSKTYRNIFDYFNQALIIGFTATPIRLNKGGLGDVFQEIITSVSTKWLVDNNCLSPFKYFSVPIADTSNVKTSRGEYDAKELSEIMENKCIYGETVKNYKLIANNKKTIVYCTSVESAKQTAEEFRQNGYIAESLDGATDKGERAEVMRRFKNNEIEILTNCELFGEGLDVPDVECVILLRKTKSLTLYIQQSMRSMRYKPNKIAYIIDHVGNVYEHDFPDADREWTLKVSSKRKKKENEVQIKTCPECFACLLSSVKVCECGYIFTVEEQKEKEVVEMHLQELTRTDVLKAKPYIYHKGIKQWEELEEFRKAKNYKFMWSIRTAIKLKIEIPKKYDNYLRRLTQQ